MIGIPVPARSLGASHVRTEWTLWAGRTHTASVWSLRGWTDGRTDGERDTRGCRQSDHTHHGAAAGVKTPETDNAFTLFRTWRGKDKPAQSAD